MRVIKAALAALLVLTLVYSCKKEEEREPCLQPQTTALHVRTMRRADSGLAVLDTLLPYPLLRPLSGQGTQYVYSFGRPTQSLSMSLNQIADSCRWSIQPDSAASSLRDTLTFYYTRQPRFLSNACGYTTFYDIRDYRTTTHAIDSVILQNPSVNNDVNVINFRIYY